MNWPLLFYVYVISMALCSNCGANSAIFFQRHSGRKLCKNCFTADILTRVKKQIELYSMIVPSDTIAVGVSGGKDSFVLLEILTMLLPSNKIFGITIDEGIEGYTRSEVFNVVKSVCRDLGIECIFVSLRDTLGYGVDDFMKCYVRGYKNDLQPVSACTYCGIARRRVLNMYARELGASKVATAHNLDDEVQTYMINILRGDIMRLIQLHPFSETHSVKLIKRIKPLRGIYEYETAFYAYLLGYQFQEYECPHIESRPTLRVKIRELLNNIELLYPGSQLHLLEFLDSIIPRISNFKAVSLPLCKLCGEPTSPSRSLCKFCELVERIKNVCTNG